MKNFIDKITSLDNIKQWEERDSVIKESVSQHSFKVSALSVFLIEYIQDIVKVDNSPAFDIFKLRCVQYAILHDFDESILGRDIGHTVKYNKFNGEEIRKVLDEYVDYKISGTNLNFLFKNFQDPDVRMFCKLCDWIAIFTFIDRNEKMGVRTFQTEREYCIENIIKVQKFVEEILLRRFEIKINLRIIINSLIQ